MYKVALASIALLAFGAVSAGTSGGASAKELSESEINSPHITVSGSANEEVTPDIAFLDLRVVDERATPDEAVAENARLSAELVADLKSLDIDAKDIRTYAVSLSPVMVEERDPKTNAVLKRTLTGYRALYDVRVTIRSIDRTGAIVRHIVSRGVNAYQGLTFKISDEEARLDALRARMPSREPNSMRAELA